MPIEHAAYWEFRPLLELSAYPGGLRGLEGTYASPQLSCMLGVKLNGTSSVLRTQSSPAPVTFRTPFFSGNLASLILPCYNFPGFVLMVILSAKSTDWCVLEMYLASFASSRLQTDQSQPSSLVFSLSMGFTIIQQCILQVENYTVCKLHSTLGRYLT